MSAAVLHDPNNPGTFHCPLLKGWNITERNGIEVAIYLTLQWENTQIPPFCPSSVRHKLGTIGPCPLSIIEIDLLRCPTTAASLASVLPLKVETIRLGLNLENWVQLACTLEEECSLHISPQSTCRKGKNSLQLVRYPLSHMSV